MPQQFLHNFWSILWTQETWFTEFWNIGNNFQTSLNYMTSWLIAIFSVLIQSQESGQQTCQYQVQVLICYNLHNTTNSFIVLIENKKWFLFFKNKCKDFNYVFACATEQWRRWKHVFLMVKLEQWNRGASDNIIFAWTSWSSWAKLMAIESLRNVL